MIKIFLVEDEIVVRNGIKNNIAWEKEGYQFVGEASDGELAYPLIKKTRPDILLTDIRMPFMDGLELSALVKKEFPKIKIIILSGYSDFEYAKRAIHIGVTDYLLKPVTAKSLLEAVGKVAGSIRQEREEELLRLRYREEMRENTVLEKQRLLNDIVTGRASFREAMERGSSLGLDFAACFYQILLFKLIPVEHPMRYSERVVACRKALEDAWGRQKRLMVFSRGADGWVLIFLGGSKEEIARLRTETEQAVRTETAGFPELGWFGGLGSVVERLNSLPDSYREASKAFSGRFFTERNRILPFDRLDAALTGRREDLDVQAIDTTKLSQKTVGNFLRSGVPDEIDGFVEEFFQSIGEQNYQSVIFRQYIVMDCYVSTCNFLKGLGLDEARVLDGLADVNRLIRDSRSVGEVKFYLKKMFAEAMRRRDEQAERKYGSLLQTACQYIDEQYANEDISLNTVASKVNISPSYFSSIFSREMGRTFVEYLTGVRLEKAKELLMCSHLNSAEIAYRVGYKDPHYFGYLFKKSVGCTPREYRTRGGRN